jgi:hypothetical protein
MDVIKVYVLRYEIFHDNQLASADNLLSGTTYSNSVDWMYLEGALEEVGDRNNRQVVLSEVIGTMCEKVRFLIETRHGFRERERGYIEYNSRVAQRRAVYARLRTNNTHPARRVMPSSTFNQTR